jgi:excinuclease UvrABC nuclease subunit
MTERNTPHGGGETGPLFTNLPVYEHGIYRIYDPDGVLVYIGMTFSPRQRLRSHVRRFKGRFDTYTWESAQSRAHAAALEAEAISNEAPTDNIAPGGLPRGGWIRP